MTNDSRHKNVTTRAEDVVVELFDRLYYIAALIYYWFNRAEYKSVPSTAYP